MMDWNLRLRDRGAAMLPDPAEDCLEAVEETGNHGSSVARARRLQFYA